MPRRDTVGTGRDVRGPSRLRRRAPVATSLTGGTRALWLVDRRIRPTASGCGSGASTTGGRSPAMLAIMGLCIVAVLATTVQVVRIGHSGAASVWDGVGQQVVSHGDGDDD